MVVDDPLRRVGALMLACHAAASTLRFEAFPAWALATLLTEVRFDGAAWGWLTAEAGAPLPRRLRAVHLHRLGDAAGALLERTLLPLATASDAPVVVDCADPPSAGADAGQAGGGHAPRDRHDASSAADRAAWRELGAAHLAALHCRCGGAAPQLLVLTRAGTHDAFDRASVDLFELLAPHLALAFVTCRRLFVDRPSRDGAPRTAVAVALVDRHGALLHGDARIVPTLRREWSDWPGTVLPEPLRAALARKAGGAGRYLGSAVAVDFQSAGPHQLLVARQRHDVDVLTAREGEIAERYAAGATFREIAEMLDLAPATVRAHLRNVFAKLQIRNKSQLAAFLRPA